MKVEHWAWISRLRLERLCGAFLLTAGVGLATVARAQTYRETVLYSFQGSPDGAYPYAGLVQDQEGNLYGTTNTGGGSEYGTVFEVSPNTQGNWTEGLLYSFGNPGENTGQAPYAGLIRDSAGNLYGTTASGKREKGTVFKLETDGNLIALHRFSGRDDGKSPYDGLLMDSAGNLYGTTFVGGRGCKTGCGTVFKIDSSGTETVLYRFLGGKDGAGPFGNVIQDKVGNLYGTTFYAGPGSGRSGDGSVFKLEKSGKKIILHKFSGSPDGSHPSAGLVQDAAGTLYGTTINGGTSNFGTVFKLSSTGNEVVLWSFKGGTDGAYPEGDLIQDAAGNLYGVTNQGGTANFGTVFMLDATGNETVLYSFAGGTSDGRQPYGGLVMDSTGNLFGTTGYGGQGSCAPSGCGIVFELSLREHPSTDENYVGR